MKTVNPLLTDSQSDKYSTLDEWGLTEHERTRYYEHLALNSALKQAFNRKTAAPSDVISRLESVIQVRATWWQATEFKAQVEIEEKFQRLALQWKRDTEHLSSMTKMILHRSYQQIIGLGSVTLKLILQELQEDPDYWFWALESITGENPVQPDDDFDAAVEAWLSWGKQRGLI